MHAKAVLLTIAFSAIAIQATALPSGVQDGSVDIVQAQIMGMASSSLYRRQEPNNNAEALTTTEPTMASVPKENKHRVEVSINGSDCVGKENESEDEHRKHHNEDGSEEDDEDDDDEDDESESSSENHHGDSQYNHEGQPQWQHNAGGDHRNNEASPSTGYPGPSGGSPASSYPPGATNTHRPSSAIKTTLKSQTVVIASLLSIVVTGYLL